MTPAKQQFLILGVIVKLRFFLAALLVIGPVAFAAPASYQFSGALTSSTKFRQVETGGVDDGPLDPFAAGQMFIGHFTVDPDAIRLTTDASATSANYYGLITSFSLRIDLGGGDSYNYRPYLDNLPGSTGQTRLRFRNQVGAEGIDFRQHNYPSDLDGDGTWAPSGAVPAEYWLGDLYPHAFFFNMLQFTNTGVLSGVGPEADYEQLFAAVGGDITLRFTDPAAASWQEGIIEGWSGNETLSGVIHGDITTLQAVPIPAAAYLFGSALGLLGWARRQKA